MTQASTPGAPSSSEREADLLIHARWLLPMTPERPVLRDHAIALRAGQILALMPSELARIRYRGVQALELPRHVLLPGFVNAHGHAAMSLLRGYADDLPLQPWLRERIWPAEARWVGEEFVLDGSRLALAEMLLGGITCSSDMYFFPDQTARAAEEAGARVQLASPIIDFPSAWAENAREYLRKTTELHDRYRRHPRIGVAFGPHSAYTVSEEPLRKIAALAEELDIPVHIHLHENAEELAEAQSRGLPRPLQWLDELGLLSPRLQAVHMTQLNRVDIALLARSGAHVVHCPSSNLKLGSGICPTAELLRHGVNVCLGTDGAASNNDLDILGELHLAVLLAKGFGNDAAALSAWDALEMATINGARALGMEEHIGSLEPGKAADLTALDLERPNTLPVYDPASALAYSASAAQVSHVWVDGQALVADGELRTLDLPYVLDKARHWGQRIRTHS